MNQLRTSLPHGCRYSTITILRGRHDTAFGRVISSYSRCSSQNVSHRSWPRPFPSSRPTRLPWFYAFGSTQNRFQNTAAAAVVKDVEPSVKELGGGHTEWVTDIKCLTTGDVSHRAEVQDQESSVRADDSPTNNLEHDRVSQSSWHGQPFHPVELLNSRALFNRIKTFLDAPERKARVYTSAILDRILPEVAALLGLEYQKRSGPGHLSILLKTHKTVSAQEVPQSLGSILRPYLTDDVLESLLTELEAALEGPHGQLFLDQHWKFLMAACKGHVKALPFMSIQDAAGVHASHGDGQDKGDYQRYIVLKNDYYNISIRRAFDSNHTSFQKVMALALLHYCQHIYKAVEADSTSGLCFKGMNWQPAEFLSRAQRALGWDTITYNDEKITVQSVSTPPVELWRCEVNMRTRGIVGKPALWINHKRARLLGTFHACAAIKPALDIAYKSGDLLPSEYQIFAHYWGETVAAARDVTAAKDAGDQIALPPSNIYKISLKPAAISRMLDALRRLRDLGFEASSQWLPADDTFEPKTNPYLGRDIDGLKSKIRYTLSKVSQDLSSRIEPPSLPIMQTTYASNISRTVTRSDITIIKAATGSGKTTQVPQLIFGEHFATASASRCNIICTQPRRVAAISVARRVAAERGQELGVEVGYQVRFDNRSPTAPNGINYVTSGYLLRLLEADPVETLTRYSHIVLDEVHERDVDTDLLLTGLKNVFMHPMSEVHRMPKIILMSATIDPGFFEEYFRNSEIQLKINSVEVPGRTFPVAVEMLHDVFPRLRERYGEEIEGLLRDKTFKNYFDLQGTIDDRTRASTNQLDDEPCDEDSDVNDSGGDAPDIIDEGFANLHVPVRLLAFMVGDVLSSSHAGDILVFLPGLGEIDQLERLLLEENILNMDLANDRKYRIFKLHSALYETNYDVFKPLPASCRRIVLATNIAETSITLPQVKFVLDTGLSRQSSYDQATQAGSFGTRWISKAEVAQRRGRAGRTQAGTYIAAYSQGQYNLMADEPTPELLRSNLDQIVLRTQVGKAFRIPSTAEGDLDVQPGQVLSLAPSAPQADNIAAAVMQLRNIHALAEDGRPTPMGRILSSMPTDPAAAKAILLSLVFRCLDPILFIGAVRDDMRIMHHPIQTGLVADVRRALAGESDDDRYADWQGFLLYDKARRNRNFDEVQTIKEGHFIRHDTYCNVAQTSEQTFGNLQTMLGHSIGNEEYNLSHRNALQPLFPTTSVDLNAHSEDENLIKALVVSISGARLAIWQKKNWRTALSRRVLPAPRSVNHINGRKHVANHLRREPGDVLAYGSLRVTPDDKYPWACDSSIVSPLTAMLFAESIHLAGTNTLIVNDWMRYRVHSEESSAAMEPARVAKIVLEYRKALDRFLAHAMSKVALDPRKLSVVRSGIMNADEFNVFFQEADHPVRKVIVDSVVDILSIDAQSRRQRAEQRAEEHRLQTEESEIQKSCLEGEEDLDVQATEQQPAEQQPAEQQPAEQQPAEQQPAERQPAE